MYKYMETNDIDHANNVGYRVARIEAIIDNLSKSVQMLFQSHEETNKSLNQLNNTLISEIHKISQIQAYSGKLTFRDMLGIGGFVVGVVGVTAGILTTLGGLALQPVRESNQQNANITYMMINDTRVDAGLPPYTIVK